MLPTLEDSIVYVRGNYNALYPSKETRRKTIGNLPGRLHEGLQEYADEENLRLYEVVGGLWDFFKEYEATYADELKAQREAVKTRRT